MRFIQTFISHLVIHLYTIFFLLNITSGTHDTIRQHFMFVNNFQLRDLVILQELVRQRIGNPTHIRSLSDMLVEIDIIVCCRETPDIFKVCRHLFRIQLERNFPNTIHTKSGGFCHASRQTARDDDDLHLSPSTLK